MSTLMYYKLSWFLLFYSSICFIKSRSKVKEISSDIKVVALTSLTSLFCKADTWKPEMTLSFLKAKEWWSDAFNHTTGSLFRQKGKRHLWEIKHLYLQSLDNY